MKTLQRTSVFHACLILLVVSVWLPSVHAAEEIALVKEGGVYKLPVKINGVLTLHFILDTGAADVQIPADVALTLFRAGTIQSADVLPGRTYTLADGTTMQSPRFILRSLQIGTRVMTQVPVSIGNLASALLLGQSVLEKVGTWSMDSQRQVLTFGTLGPLPRQAELEQAERERRKRQAEDTERRSRDGKQAEQQQRENILVAQGMKFIAIRQFLCLNTQDNLVLGTTTLTGASSLSCEDARRALMAESEKKNACASPSQKEGQKQWIGTASCPAP